MVSWIPSQFAKKGKYLRLKNEAGEWENGWRVMATWVVKDAKYVELKARDHLHQAEASDI